MKRHSALIVRCEKNHPPPMWGIRPENLSNNDVAGINPTNVGEYNDTTKITSPSTGSPPPMWGNFNVQRIKAIF